MGWRLLNYVHIALFRVTFNKKEKKKSKGQRVLLTLCRPASY